MTLDEAIEYCHKKVEEHTSYARHYVRMDYYSEALSSQEHYEIADKFKSILGFLKDYKKLKEI